MGLTVYASSSVSTNYPGCDKSDVIIGKQIWAPCDVSGSFVFGTGTDVKNLNMKKFNSWKSHWNEKDQGVCATWYHIPTNNEWKALFSGLSCKLNTGTANKNQKCGKFVISQLNLSGNGRYWTSSENNKGSAWGLRINLDAKDKNYYGYSSVSVISKTTGLSIRCIKN